MSRDTWVCSCGTNGCKSCVLSTSALRPLAYYPFSLCVLHREAFPPRQLNRSKFTFCATIVSMLSVPNPRRHCYQHHRHHHLLLPPPSQQPKPTACSTRPLLPSPCPLKTNPPYPLNPYPDPSLHLPSSRHFPLQHHLFPPKTPQHSSSPSFLLPPSHTPASATFACHMQCAFACAIAW